MKTGRWRLLVLLGVVVAAVSGAGVYVAWPEPVSSRGTTPVAAAGVATRSQLAAAATGPHVVFRSTASGDGYGHVAIAPLAMPDGPRAITPATCDRVYAARDRAVCLAGGRGFTISYQTLVLGPDWKPRRELPLSGIPSRTRMSRDGSLIATTAFIRGHGYASQGEFSTQTLVTHTGGADIGDLENFTLVVDGQVVTAADKNVWGVTFADDDRFYATAAFGHTTWLVEGSLSARRLTARRQDAECPSLSPDGTRVVFKRRGDLPAGNWRLTVYDLATGRESQLAESRTVDDQVEWLDNAHVIYGLPRAAATSDVWVVSADGSGAPQVFIHDAWSPAVVP